MKTIILPTHEIPGKRLSQREQAYWKYYFEMFYRKHRWWAKWLFSFFSILYNPFSGRLEIVTVLYGIVPFDQHSNTQFIIYQDYTVKINTHIVL